MYAVPDCEIGQKIFGRRAGETRGDKQKKKYKENPEKIHSLTDFWVPGGRGSAPQWKDGPSQYMEGFPPRGEGVVRVEQERIATDFPSGGAIQRPRQVVYLHQKKRSTVAEGKDCRKKVTKGIVETQSLVAKREEKTDAGQVTLKPIKLVHGQRETWCDCTRGTGEPKSNNQKRIRCSHLTLSKKAKR